MGMSTVEYLRAGAIRSGSATDDGDAHDVRNTHGTRDVTTSALTWDHPRMAGEMKDSLGAVGEDVSQSWKRLRSEKWVDMAQNSLATINLQVRGRSLTITGPSPRSASCREKCGRSRKRPEAGSRITAGGLQNRRHPKHDAAYIARMVRKQRSGRREEGRQK